MNCRNCSYCNKKSNNNFYCAVYAKQLEKKIFDGELYIDPLQKCYESNYEKYVYGSSLRIQDYVTKVKEIAKSVNELEDDDMKMFVLFLWYMRTKHKDIDECDMKIRNLIAQFDFDEFVEMLEGVII